MSLNEREKYCLALIIANGGQADYEILRDVILEFKESFGDISEDYLKYQAIKRTLEKLEETKFVSESSGIYKLNPMIEPGFIKESPFIITKAIKNFASYRKNHILEFNTRDVENYLLSEHYIMRSPYGLIENLKGALNLQQIESYDSVLVKCGKCVEIMVNYLDENYLLFDTKISTGKIIQQFRKEEIIDKIKDDIDKDTWRTFTDGINIVYRFRNLMGAHADWTWGEERIAISCLILTFYLVDLFLTDIHEI